MCREVPAAWVRSQLDRSQERSPGAEERSAPQRSPAALLERRRGFMRQLLGHSAVELGPQPGRVVEVVRADAEQFVARLLVDPLSKRLMLVRPERLAHAAVRYVADQHMREAESAIAGDRRALFGNDELPVEQLVEQRVDREIGLQSGEGAAPEHAPGEGRGLEYAFLVRAQPIDPRRDHRLHSVRQAADLLALPKHPRYLLEEEGIALGALEDERPLGGRDLDSGEERVGELPALVGVECAKFDGSLPRTDGCRAAPAGRSRRSARGLYGASV